MKYELEIWGGLTRSNNIQYQKGKRKRKKAENEKPSWKRYANWKNK